MRQKRSGEHGAIAARLRNKSYVELRYAQPFLNSLQRSAKDLTIATETAARSGEIQKLSESQRDVLEERVRDVLEHCAPRRMTRDTLAGRSASILVVLLQAKARHTALRNSGLHALVQRIRKLNDKYRNAKDQSRSQEGSVKRLLRTQAMSLIWAHLNKSASDALAHAESAFAGAESTHRRLAGLGVPASTIPKLFKLIGLPRTTTSRAKNLLIRKRVLPPTR